MFKDIVNRILDLLKESVITQSMLVILVFGPIAYCVITGQTVPETLDRYALAMIGFFFGSKSALQVLKGLGKWKRQL